MLYLALLYLNRYFAHICFHIVTVVDYSWRVIVTVVVVVVGRGRGRGCLCGDCGRWRQGTVGGDWLQRWIRTFTYSCMWTRTWARRRRRGGGRGGGRGATRGRRRWGGAARSSPDIRAADAVDKLAVDVIGNTWIGCGGGDSGELLLKRPMGVVTGGGDSGISTMGLGERVGTKSDWPLDRKRPLRTGQGAWFGFEFEFCWLDMIPQGKCVDWPISLQRIIFYYFWFVRICENTWVWRRFGLFNYLIGFSFVLVKTLEYNTAWTWEWMFFTK